MQVLLVNPPGQELPEGTADLLGDVGCEVTRAGDYRTAVEAAGSGAIDLVIVSEPASAAEHTTVDDELRRLLRLVDGERIATLVLTDRPSSGAPPRGSLVERVGRDVSLAELRGRLVTIDRYHAFVKQLERELRGLEKLSKRLNRHFHEVDQEMRLAGRLQRDFLPRIVEPIGGLQFATVYRPASWVSGDIFDILRVDEEHVGFYIADAVGHGLAAGLLTMFIKRSIVPKRVQGDQYVIHSPAEVMSALNDVLADQSQPNCQFVTCCYVLLNHKTLRLQYARGGHPYPMLIGQDGNVTELKSPGGLLGLFKGDDFPSYETRLQPGDKLILYTDGVEHAFGDPPSDVHAKPPYQLAVEANAKRPIRELMNKLEEQADRVMGSLSPRDDLTMIGVEALPTNGSR